MTFSSALKQLRTNKNMSQTDLAKATGVSKSAISMYENGQRFPDESILDIFAKFFDVDMNTLLGKAPISQPQQDFISYLTSRLTPKGRQLLEEHLKNLAHDPNSVDANQIIKDIFIDNLTPEAQQKQKELAQQLRIQRKIEKAYLRELAKRKS